MRSFFAVFLFIVSASFVASPIHIATSKMGECIGDLVCINTQNIPFIVLGCLTLGVVVGITAFWVLTSGKKNGAEEAPK